MQQVQREQQGRLEQQRLEQQLGLRQLEQQLEPVPRRVLAQQQARERQAQRLLLFYRKRPMQLQR